MTVRLVARLVQILCFLALCDALCREVSAQVASDSIDRKIVKAIDYLSYRADSWESFERPTFFSCGASSGESEAVQWLIENGDRAVVPIQRELIRQVNDKGRRNVEGIPSLSLALAGILRRGAYPLLIDFRNTIRRSGRLLDLDRAFALSLGAMSFVSSDHMSLKGLILCSPLENPSNLLDQVFLGLLTQANEVVLSRLSGPLRGEASKILRDGPSKQSQGPNAPIGRSDLSVAYKLREIELQPGSGPRANDRHAQVPAVPPSGNLRLILSLLSREGNICKEIPLSFARVAGENNNERNLLVGPTFESLFAAFHECAFARSSSSDGTGTRPPG
jgi:hypothetical protein